MVFYFKLINIWYFVKVYKPLNTLDDDEYLCGEDNSAYCDEHLQKPIWEVCIQYNSLL